MLRGNSDIAIRRGQSGLLAISIAIYRNRAAACILAINDEDIRAATNCTAYADSFQLSLAAVTSRNSDTISAFKRCTLNVDVILTLQLHAAINNVHCTDRS